MTTFAEVQRRIHDENIEFIDFKVVDIHGHWHHLTIPATRFTPDIMENGIGFDGSNYGYTLVNRSDMLFIPDLSTGTRDVFFDRPTLSFIGEIYVPDAGIERSAQDPRWVAKKAEKALANSELADMAMFGPELEFYVFDRVRYQTDANLSFYYLNPEEKFWELSGERQAPGLPPYRSGYHLLPPHDQLADLRNDITAYLETNGVKVKYHHHEVGGRGQLELETEFGGLVQMADSVLLAKYATKNMAHRRGKTATFMPKPLYEEAGNGMHVHLFLLKNGQNVFDDPQGYYHLSQTALHFIGGILHHAPALCALTNPSTNSYKRLIPGFEAPVTLTFAAANRSAAIRIPTYVKNGATRRIEYRPIDATCNPYLAFAGLLMAGLDGIISEIDPSEEGFGPFEGNMYKRPETEREKVKALPRSLDEALTALASDHEFLLRDNVFTKNLLDGWIAAKTEESRDVQLKPHPAEFELYYDI